MKSSNLLRFIIPVLAAGALLLSTPTVFGQAQGGAGGGGRGRGAQALANLTEDQRAALQEINTALRDLNTKLREARTELNDVIFAAKVDEAAIKAKAAAVGQIESELAVARAKEFAKVRSKFDDAAIQALKASGNFPGGRAGGRGQRAQ